MSYGDKRRVEIVRALAAEPRFRLLDEPTAGMNDTETEALLQLLSSLPEARRLGLLIVDHDMALMMGFAIACMCWLPVVRSQKATPPMGGPILPSSKLISEREPPMPKVRDLCVNYGTIRAAHGTSFTVGKGGLVSLLDANG
nr:ATP-binding cassette domain-containing protein [Ochrobactrum sp. 3-3]